MTYPVVGIIGILPTLVPLRTGYPSNLNLVPAVTTSEEGEATEKAFDP